MLIKGKRQLRRKKWQGLLVNYYACWKLQFSYYTEICTLFLNNELHILICFSQEKRLASKTNYFKKSTLNM